jgi:hypothetical protein
MCDTLRGKAMTTRVLPPDEWSRLETDGTYLKDVWRVLNPAYMTVLVVEDAGRIVGTWVAQLQMHVEGFWIAPEKRDSGGVFRSLLRHMEQFLAGVGCDSALTGAADLHVESMIGRLGGEPVLTYRVPFRSKHDRTRGEAFHDELGAHATHADDPEHDRQVGQALRIAFDEHDPPRAMALYNAWAPAAGYAPISAWEPRETGVRVHFGDLAPIDLTLEGHVCLPASS